MGLAHPNHLLACMAARERIALQQQMTCIPLSTGAILQRADEEMAYAYFPRCGILSLVVTFSDGAIADAGVVGANSVLGGVAALGGELSLATLTVLMDGAADRIAIEDLRRCTEESADLRALLRKHAHALLAQAFQIGACNAVHTLEERLCRWLLQCRDLVQMNTLPLTHELLAGMLGVRRSSVTVVAGRLQEAGLISWRRGCVELLDVASLRATACECYETIVARTERLTGWAPERSERTCA